MSWLVKEEPTHYNFTTFLEEGRTTWSGVRNPVAQKHLRAMKKGDAVLYYHTGNEKAVVGLATVASEPYADPTDKAGTFFAVDLTPERALARPVTLAEIKAAGIFENHPLTRVPRLSVMPIADDLWKWIQKTAAARG
jgi:predicted RNA-binding protein with PUA-like domain